jgi:hypothetical protein
MVYNQVRIKGVKAMSNGLQSRGRNPSIIKRRMVPAMYRYFILNSSNGSRGDGVAKNILAAGTDKVGRAFGRTAQAHARNEAAFRPVTCGKRLLVFSDEPPPPPTTSSQTLTNRLS